ACGGVQGGGHFPSPACGGGQGGGCHAGAVANRGVEHGADLCLLLKDRLQERHVHARLLVIGVGASRDLVYRAAENEGIEQLIGDELAGPVIILGPPGGGDLGAELRVEAGALQRDVAQDGDHVDHEG